MSFKMNDNNDQDEIVAEINMTPLIDIMLVLLIIFMVTSSVNLESGLDIDLPKTTGQTKSQAPEAIVVSLNKNGEVAVSGKIVTMDNLKTEISKALMDSKTEMVVFEGDQTTQIGRAIEIMDVAKEAGAKKFAMAAEQKSN